jgi:hypothetical protein
MEASYVASAFTQVALDRFLDRVFAAFLAMAFLTEAVRIQSCVGDEHGNKVKLKEHADVGCGCGSGPQGHYANHIGETRPRHPRDDSEIARLPEEIGASDSKQDGRVLVLVELVEHLLSSEDNLCFRRDYSYLVTVGFLM